LLQYCHIIVIFEIAIHDKTKPEQGLAISDEAIIVLIRIYVTISCQRLHKGTSPMKFQKIYDDWQHDQEQFWAKQAEAVSWMEHPKTIFKQIDNQDRWYPDGSLNTCYNCVDRHVENGRGEATALIYDSPVTGKQESLSFLELQERVSCVAAMMEDVGIVKGDRVIIYMPMILETAIAALACARIGAVHSIVFGGFAANELATRIDDAKPKLILAASCGIEPGRVIAYKPLLDAAIDMAEHQPDHCILFQRETLSATLKPERDLDWITMEQRAKASAYRPPCISVSAIDPLYILYTSGTTGIPKGVVRDNGGHMVALLWSIKNIYNIGPNDVFWAASDMGWVVGHSYILYAPLAIGACSIIYEGKPVGTPDAGAFWRVIEAHKVNALFTAPTAFRAIKKEDPEGKRLNDYNLTSLKTLFLAGERVDPATIQWAEKHLKVPVIDNWWQTETGWPICANPLGIELLPIKHGSPAKPMPGFSVHILDETQCELTPGNIGSIVIKRPLPPGCLPTLWNNDAGFSAAYLDEFPGFYKTGDAGFIDEEGYLYIMSRTDDIINVAGHRLSTGGIEEVIAGHPDIAECAVLSVNDALKGEIPLGLIVLNDGVTISEEIILKDCVSKVRNEIGPVAAFKLILRVDRLPKTRSGKILRGTIRKIANGEAWTMPATIDDPQILDDIANRLAQIGYPKQSET